MKIVFVIGRLADTAGGAERVLRDISVGLTQRGHDVSILSHSKDTKPPRHGFDGAVRHFNLFPCAASRRARLAFWLQRAVGSKIPLGAALQKARYKARLMPFAEKVRTYVDKTRPDLSVGFMGEGICALHLGGATGSGPGLASLHSAPARLFETLDGKAQVTLEALASYDAVSFPLEEHVNAGRVAEQHGQIVLPNPVDLGKPPDATRRGPIVAAVGRLVPVKRFDLLLGAWALCERKNWTLEIHGDGPERPRLLALIAELGISDSVVLAGHSKDIFSVYERASILAHPSRFEGFGLVLAEAMGRGVPVVGFADTPGVRSLVENERNGLLVTDNGSMEAFAQTLSRLICNPDLRARLSADAPATVADYRLENVLDAWETAFDAIIDKR